MSTPHQNCASVDLTNYLNGLIANEERDLSFIDELNELSIYLSVNEENEQIAAQQGRTRTDVMYEDLSSSHQTQHKNHVSGLNETDYLIRERKRKYSHNLVEQRRRFKINDKIKELESLLPGHNTCASVPQNKYSVLTATVDYIKQVQGEPDRLRLVEERHQRHEQQIKKIIRLLKSVSVAVHDRASHYEDNDNEIKPVSKFVIKGYIPVYQANQDEDKRNVCEVYSTFKETE